MVFKYLLNLIGIVLLCQTNAYGYGRGSSCLNRYLRHIKILYGDKIIGKFAHVKLIEERGDGVIVRFECPRDYHAPNRWRSFMKNNVLIHCFLNMNPYSALSWPVCRSRYENVTCSNEYFYSNSSNGKKWLKESKNLLHAEYSPYMLQYPYKTRLSFRCPPGYTFHNALGLVVVETECKDDGGWKKEWPLCRGNTCTELVVINGIVEDSNQRYDPGVQLHISCEPGYYLWGSDTATCTKQLRWSSNAGECLTKNMFRRKCEKERKSLVIDVKDGNETLYCSAGPGLTVAVRGDKSSVRYELAIGIGIPSFFAVIVFTVFAVLYVRHQRKLYFRRQENIRAIYTGRETVQLILPTYEEALKNKPTTPPPTFEETFQLNSEDACSAVINSNIPSDRPPSYTPT